MFTNSRMGLSAHLAGVQNGMVLLIFGLMWHHLKVGEVWRKLARWLSIFSMYAIWFGLLLAAVWGTSKSTPIAGAGYEGSETQELVVSALIQVGSGAIIVAVVIILLGLVTRRMPGRV